MSIPGPEDVQRYELSNGITMLVRENYASPTVVMSGYLPVGSYDEAPEEAGLTAFTISALTRGTENRTFDQVYEEVEAVGASIGFSAGVHQSGFGGKSLAEDLPLILDVLADVLRNPTFPAREVEKLRGEILTSLEQRLHNTRRMASLTFRELTYPADHPYGRSRVGYQETVAPLTRDDLTNFYEGGFGPQGMVIAIAGAVEAQDALAQVEGAFGDWEGETYTREPLPPVSPPEQVREKFVPIAGKTQTDLVLGYPGPSRTDPNFLDAALCNTILGIFGMMGRLGERIRNEQGLAYYCYSRVEGGLGPRPWSVIAGVNPVNVEQALESIRVEIRRICEEKVSEEELVDSQTYLIGSLPLRLETNEGVAKALLNMERYELGMDYLQRYSDLIRAITPEGVQKAAKAWLNPDAYVCASAGPALEKE